MCCAVGRLKRPNTCDWAKPARARCGCAACRQAAPPSYPASAGGSGTATGQKNTQMTVGHPLHIFFDRFHLPVLYLIVGSQNQKVGILFTKAAFDGVRNHACGAHAEARCAAMRGRENNYRVIVLDHNPGVSYTFGLNGSRLHVPHRHCVVLVDCAQPLTILAEVNRLRSGLQTLQIKDWIAVGGIKKAQLQQCQRIFEKSSKNRPKSVYHLLCPFLPGPR